MQTPRPEKDFTTMLENIYEKGINKDQQRKVQAFEKILVIAHIKHFKLDSVVNEVQSNDQLLMKVFK
jgi:hypothetical protein